MTIINIYKMNKVIDFLDFLPGYKTYIFSALTTVVILWNLVMDASVDYETLKGLLVSLFYQIEVMATSAGVAYGIIMKIIRMFRA